MATRERSDAFDPVLHSSARLKLVLLIASTTTASFNELAREAALTHGNLASHLRTLEGAGYVEALHALVDLKPRRRYRLTPRGRDALQAYRRSLEEAVRQIEELPAPPLAARPEADGE